MRSALLLFLALPVLALDVRILDMNEEVTTGTALAIDGDNLLVTLPGGAKKSIPCDTVVEITFPANDGAQGGNPMVEVVLSNGDVIRGDVTGGDESTISLAAGEMGRMEVPLENVSRLLVLVDNNMEKVPPDAAAGDEDRLYLANRDTDVGFPPEEGDVLTPEGITIVSSRTGKPVTYAWKQLAGWYIAGVKSVPMPDDLIATVVCSGGTRLTGRVNSVTGTTLTLDHVVVGKIPVPIAAVRAIYFINGRVTYLSDLPVAASRERPFIYDPERPDASPFPFRRDASVGEGRPLTIKGREFRKGLGVHSYSALEFATNRAYSKFCASIGLDQEAVGADGGSGSVVFQVWAGKLDQVDPDLRLYTTHVKDWKALCERLKGARRFWGMFNEAARAAMEEIASGEEATEARRIAVRNAVNAALARADLYDPDAFPAERLPDDARTILGKDRAKRTARETDRLHRRCLELAVGDAIEHVAQPAKLLYDSGLVRYGEEPRDISVSVQGLDSIVLVVRCGLEGDIFDGETWDRADWGGARFIK